MAPSLLLVAQLLLAVQVPQAWIVGTVRDGETGAPLPGAAVVLADLGRVAVADASGRYGLPRVPAGPQHLVVRSVGYSPRTLHALVPSEGRVEINVVLQPEPISIAGVEVVPGVPVRGAWDRARVDLLDRELSALEVSHHPLTAEPDFLQALGGSFVSLSPESPSGVNLRGGGSDQTGYVLDGIPVFSPYHASALFGAWNPDAVERLALSSAAPSAAGPHVLSGVVEAVTRTPGSEMAFRGSASTTQIRATVDGPLPFAGAGILASVRRGFPGTVAPRAEASYLRGWASDWMVKLEAPLLEGGLRLVAYDSEDELNAVAGAEGEASTVRNAFEWHGRAWGGEWRRELAGVEVLVRGWRSSLEADAGWLARAGGLELGASRTDHGLLASVERVHGVTRTLAGVRLERSRTRYVLDGSEEEAREARTPVATAFLENERELASDLGLRLGVSLARSGRRSFLSPRGLVRWEPTSRSGLSLAYARNHQFSQSVRNPESVVSALFPADLYLGAGARGVPVARGDQLVLGWELRPIAGLRVGLQAYARRMEGMLLVAATEEEPFRTGDPVAGSARATGIALDVAVSQARWGAVLSYGWQRFRYDVERDAYVPGHGATHRVDGGVVFFTTTTSSVRLGATGIFGRRGTDALGSFEWEACNLLDQGCEFVGSPRSGDVGRRRLPAYARVDLSARKHWHIRVRHRDMLVGLFGTVTNLFGRANVLTFAEDPLTGDPAPVEMRPLAPLVFGLDWSF